MPFKRELNAELKRLREQAKALEKERDNLTKEVNARLQENQGQQDALTSYMKMRFGEKPAKPARGRPRKVVAPKTGRGKRKDRSDVRPRVLAIINANVAGIRRKAILAEMGLESDPAGKQYVSNTIKDLREEGLVRAVGRQYFPGSAASTSIGGRTFIDSRDAEDSSSTSSTEPSETVSDSGFGSESSGGESESGSSSGSPSF